MRKAALGLIGLFVFLLATGCANTVPDPEPQAETASNLFEAALDGDLATAQRFLDSGANVNARFNDNNTPLHGAALGGNVAIVQLLLAKGANVNATNSANGTPMDVAAGNEQVCAVLRAHGGTENLRAAGEDAARRFLGNR